MWSRVSPWISVHLAPPWSCNPFEGLLKLFIPYLDPLVKRFCLTLSPYLTLSFSPLINLDGEPDSSRGQNPYQDRSLTPCYHHNGFRRGPPDTGERGNEFMKLDFAYFSLCLCLPLPFLPSHHPSSYTASFKLLAPHNTENIFDIIMLYAPATQCTIHSASLKPHTRVLTEN